MFHILKLLIIFLTFNSYHTKAETLKCNFIDQGYHIYAETFYTCDVTNDIFTTKIEIDFIEGTHKSGMTNYDVKNLYGSAKNTQYIPKGIEKFFPNLIQIKIWAKVKEIHQEDLKPFHQLKYLHLGNELLVLEKDLFKFNPAMEVIWLENNKISHIDSGVFSDLKNLEQLSLHRNKCSTELGVAITKCDVEKIVRQVETGICVDPFYKVVEEISEKRIKTLTDLTEDLSENLKKCATELSSKSLEMESKIDELKRKNSQLIEEIENQKSQVKNLQEYEVKNLQEIVQLNNKVSVTKVENLKLGDDLKQKSDELETLKSSIARAQVDIKNCQTHTETLKNEIQDKAKVIESEKTTQSNTIRDIKADIDAFKLSMGQSNAQLNETVNKVSAQLHQNELKQNQILSIGQSNTQLNEAVNKLSAELHQNELKNFQEIAELKRKFFTKYEQQNFAIEQQRIFTGFESLSSFVVQAYNEIKAYQENVQSMKNKLNNSTIVIESLQKQTTEMQMKIDQNSQLVDNKSNVTANVTATVTALQDQLYTCNSSITDTLKKYEVCQAFVKLLKETILTKS